jgi:hypothetical protein
VESNSQKPKEWMGIANEPNYRFATAHVRVLLLKGPAHLPCLLYLAPILLYLAFLALFALLYSCPTLFCLALHCLPYPWPCLFCHVTIKGAIIGVVPFPNELVKHEKVLPIS